jgi:predicted DNA-binding protein (MmcQ/YjbR family)
MLDNFKKTKQAVLTEEQKKSLINFKQQRLITPLFTDRYYKFKPGYYSSINYNYNPVYEEVKKYE